MERAETCRRGYAPTRRRTPSAHTAAVPIRRMPPLEEVSHCHNTPRVPAGASSDYLGGYDKLALPRRLAMRTPVPV